MESIFKGIFDSQTVMVVPAGTFLLCTGISLVLGLLTALCARYRTSYSAGFFTALAVLPAIVCMLIMMVNGNIGASVSIAGAFTLVRFRSTQGDAKQIALVFLAMAAGLVTGMGYLAYAVLFTVILCLSILFLSRIWEDNTPSGSRIIKITIPEDLDYTGVFDSILERYTSVFELLNVKTCNMGSLFKLTYQAEIADISREKSLIDELRCRNGNLEVAIMAREEERPAL